jgi:hypothetical protein
MRPRTRDLLVAALALTGISCDRFPEVAMTTPQPSGFSLPSPDVAFRLSPEERASVRRGFDADALERLLSRLIPPVRPMVLGAFQYPPAGESPALMIKIGEPSLQPLLDEVWAPMWEHFPPNAIDIEDKDFPGRELARKRREARGQNGPAR